MEIIPLGATSLPQEVIAEYLTSLKEIYTAEVCLPVLLISLTSHMLMKRYSVI